MLGRQSAGVGSSTQLTWAQLACAFVSPKVVFVAAMWCGAINATVLGLTIDFEELQFPLGLEYYNGSDGAGQFASHGVVFNNHFTDYGGGCCWEGLSYSRVEDTTTPGFGNQYASFSGGGAAGSRNYAVMFSGIDAGNGDFISTITLPSGALPASIDVTNTTYAALSMRIGDGFADPFGGLSGHDPDWYRLRIVALNSQSQPLGEVPFYLADYRLADDALDYIVDQWTTLDLQSLAVPDVAFLQLRVDSSDVGQFGMNTPAYVAIDNLRLAMPLAGDFNRDGAVDAADYTVWRDTFGQSVAPGSGADADRDAMVTSDDYAIWRSQFGNSAAAASSAVGAVPELSGVTYLTCVLVSLLLWRNRS